MLIEISGYKGKIQTNKISRIWWNHSYEDAFYIKNRWITNFFLKQLGFPSIPLKKIYYNWGYYHKATLSIVFNGATYPTDYVFKSNQECEDVYISICKLIESENETNS